MTVWYPNDLHYRPIQASLFVARSVFHDFERVHETELVNHLDNLKDYAHPFDMGLGAIAIDGAISLTANGQELLGKQGNLEFNGIAGGPNTITDHGGPAIRRYGRGLQYSFDRQGDVFRFHYYENNQITRQTTLPAADVLLEWDLMNYRLTRIRAALGDVNASGRVDNYLALAGGFKSTLTYTLSAPLHDVLTNPAPQDLYEQERADYAADL